MYKLHIKGWINKKGSLVPAGVYDPNMIGEIVNDAGCIPATPEDIVEARESGICRDCGNVMDICDDGGLCTCGFSF